MKGSKAEKENDALRQLLTLSEKNTSILSVEVNEPILEWP